MNLFLKKYRPNRFGLIGLLVLLLVVISLLTRIAFLIYSASSIDFTLTNLAIIFGVGFFFDLVNASYFMLPLLFFLWLCPEKLYQKKGFRFALYALFVVFNFILLFNAVAEWFFWDEFNTRFNFIAVDYLVYTTEVIGNIRQSYPVEWIIVGITLAAALITFGIKDFILKSSHVPIRFKARTGWLIGLICLPLLSFMLVDNRLHHIDNNSYVTELSGNGLYELFAAYRNNELDYDQFYQHINSRKADQNIHRILRNAEPTSIQTDSLSIQREIVHAGEETKLNVVMISIESFSAKFMSAFGNDEGITPFLDSLAQHSLFFTNLYATGTRTVRGLEALSLAVPPTPGQSIVRRPRNENLFSLASVFNTKGYESKFIYGGYGYFDNMGYFFENNAYYVVDRSALDDSEIDYENIWGVADENLFTLVTREIERTTSKSKPVFTHIMTTSNHRPYTYPEGRIDIPSHTGREGAVKYTDYAIGKFIREACKTEWYANTIFVITADHCASSAGKTELPIGGYHVPMLIFSPGHIQPGVQGRLMSQIDIAPTILGMLNFSYTSKFFGYDIHALPEGKERVFISTYQLLGYIKSDSLVILAPNKPADVYVIGEDHESVTKVDDASNLPVVVEAITWYETASHAFKNGFMKIKN